MAHEYSCAVVIGRFQPLHNSHVELISQALRVADKAVVLVGSSFSTRTINNPFSFEDRSFMIRVAFSDIPHNRLIIEPIRDFFYSDDVWLANVQAACAAHIEDGESVALLGLYKDQSSYYLNMFPQWEYMRPGAKVNLDLNATSVRNALFNVDFSTAWKDDAVGSVIKLSDETVARQDAYFEQVLPEYTANFLSEFRKTEIYTNLVEEYRAVQSYKEAWEKSPYPPTFVTADAVVTCSGHVLVVRRGGNPGKGLLALPGGFVRENERVRDAALRELKEETRIKVDKLILDSNIVDNDVFDYPGRSLRGRTITHAFHIKLKNGKLPEVKGSDDAKGAFWIPFVEVMQRAEEFFEDHVHVISRFINN